MTAPSYAGPVAIDPMAGAETGPVIRSTGVGVLDRVVAVLDAVETRRMTASELARHLGLSVPTAHRLVGSMMAHGLLGRDADGRLRLGHRFAVPYLEHVAASVLTDLQQQTRETAQIWVRRGEHRLCLASVDSPEELRASVPVGTLLPLTAGGSAARILTEPVARWVESISQRTPGLCSVSAARSAGPVGIRSRRSASRRRWPGSATQAQERSTATRCSPRQPGCRTRSNQALIRTPPHPVPGRRESMPCRVHTRDRHVAPVGER